MLIGAARPAWDISVHYLAALRAVRHRRVGASVIHVLAGDRRALDPGHAVARITCGIIVASSCGLRPHAVPRETPSRSGHAPRPNRHLPDRALSSRRWDASSPHRRPKASERLTQTVLHPRSSTRSQEAARRSSPRSGRAGPEPSNAGPGHPETVPARRRRPSPWARFSFRSPRRAHVARKRAIPGRKALRGSERARVRLYLSRDHRCKGVKLAG